jgi:tripartite-type tricarboxylate transporter receptor subunit TctC
MFSSLPSMKGMVDKGLIRVVGVTAESKSPTYKDYPLIKKTLPGFEYATWYGIYGPADMPKPIVQRLSQSLNKLGADRGLEARLREQGVDLQVTSPEALADRTRKETAQWDKVIQEAGIHLN